MTWVTTGVVLLLQFSDTAIVAVLNCDSFTTIAIAS